MATGGSVIPPNGALHGSRRKARSWLPFFSDDGFPQKPFPKYRVLLSSAGAPVVATGWQELLAIFAGVEFEAKRMSIADHFQQAPDAGFIRNFDSDAARRQFRVSMVLVIVIAAAAAALGAVVRFDGPATSTVSPVASTPPHYAGRL